MLKSYKELRAIDVIPFCDTRKAKDDMGKEILVPYLNWAKCKDLLHDNGAEVVYFIPLTNENGSSLFMSDVEFFDKDGKINRCYEVRVNVFIDDKEYIMNTPLMNGAYVVRNDTMNQLRLANAQARAFVKCVAIHTGLGFGLWVKNDELNDNISEDDLSQHKILSIKIRVENLITNKIKKGMDTKDIYSALNVSEKNFNMLMDYYSKLNNFEKAIEKL